MNNMQKSCKAAKPGIGRGYADGGLVEIEDDGSSRNLMDSELNRLQSARRPNTTGIQGYNNGGFVQKMRDKFMGSDTGIAISNRNRMLDNAGADPVAQPVQKVSAPVTSTDPETQRLLDKYRNMKDGGLVKGKGGPTDDMVPAALPEGHYVLPADTTKKIGIGVLNEIKDATHQKGSPNEKGIRVNLSNGEYDLPEDTAAKIGIGKLDKLVKATHKPVKGKGPGHFANGTPGGIDEQLKRGDLHARARQRIGNALAPAANYLGESFDKGIGIAKSPAATVFNALDTKAYGNSMRQEYQDAKAMEHGTLPTATANAHADVMAGGVGKFKGGSIIPAINKADAYKPPSQPVQPTANDGIAAQPAIQSTAQPAPIQSGTPSADRYRDIAENPNGGNATNEQWNKMAADWKNVQPGQTVNEYRQGKPGAVETVDIKPASGAYNPDNVRIQRDQDEYWGAQRMLQDAKSPYEKKLAIDRINAGRADDTARRGQDATKYGYDQQRGGIQDKIAGDAPMNIAHAGVYGQQANLYGQQAEAAKMGIGQQKKKDAFMDEYLDPKTTAERKNVLGSVLGFKDADYDFEVIKDIDPATNLPIQKIIRVEKRTGATSVVGGGEQQKAPDSAIAYLKANPSQSAAFKAKYGYLPETK